MIQRGLCVPSLSTSCTFQSTHLTCVSLHACRLFTLVKGCRPGAADGVCSHIGGVTFLARRWVGSRGVRPPGLFHRCCP